MTKQEKINELGSKFSRWTKGIYDRIYFEATDLGLEYKQQSARGYLDGVTLDGEHISNGKGNALIGAKMYLDLTDWTLHFSSDDAEKAFREKIEAMITFDEDDTQDQQAETEDPIEAARHICEAHGYTLPELTGTEKQIKWAESIRAEKVTRLFYLWDLRTYTDDEQDDQISFDDICDTYSKEKVEQYDAKAAEMGCWSMDKTYKAIFEYILGRDSASFWIDWRDDKVGLRADNSIIRYAMEAIEKASDGRLTRERVGRYRYSFKDNQDHEKEQEAQKAAEEQKALAEQKAKDEREARIVSVKYKDLKNDVWAGKITQTVRDSYDADTKTIQVYTVSPEAKAEIEAYYGKKTKNAMPQQVRDFKDGYIDEYTITPPVISAVDIDNTVPEALRNG